MSPHYASHSKVTVFMLCSVCPGWNKTLCKKRWYGQKYLEKVTEVSPNVQQNKVHHTLLNHVHLTLLHT